MFLFNMNMTTGIFLAMMLCFLLYAGFSFYKGYNFLCQCLNDVNSFLDSKSIEYLQLNYETIKLELLKNDIIGDLWKEYDKTLLRIVSDQSSMTIYSTCDASYYFNNEIISSKIDIDMCNAFPGYFTGLGIFGTFLGLTIGLSGMNISTKDVDLLSKGIQGMLEGTSTAFYTSLAGLISALPFSFLTKRGIGKLKSQISLLQSNIDKKFPRCLMESILADSKKELAAQTAGMKQFKGDLADALYNAVSNGVSNNLQPTLEKLCDSVQGLEKNLAPSIYSAVNDGLSKNLKPALEQLHGAIQELNSSGSSAVSESIKGSVGDKIDELKDIIVSMSDAAKNLSDQSGKMGGQFESLMKESSHRMAGIYEKSSAQQSEVNNKVMTQIGEMMGMIKSTMDSTVTQFSSVHNTANSQMNQTFNDISSQLVTLVEVIDETQSKSNNMLKSTVNEISDKFTQMSENLLAQSKAQSESSSKVTGDTISKLNEMAENFVSVSSVNNMEMAGYVKEIKKLLDSCSDVMNGASSTADNFKSAAVPVKESADSLKENLVVLNATQRDFLSFSDAIMAKAEKNNDASAQTLVQLRALIQDTDDTVRKYKENFDGLANDISEVFGKLHEGLVDYGEVTRSNIAKQLEISDEKISAMMSYIGGGIQELGDVVTSLETLAENFSNGKR